MRQRPEGYIASWMRLKRSHLDLEFWLQNATWALRNDAFFTFFFTFSSRFSAPRTRRLRATGAMTARQAPRQAAERFDLISSHLDPLK